MRAYDDEDFFVLRPMQNGGSNSLVPSPTISVRDWDADQEQSVDNE